MEHRPTNSSLRPRYQRDTLPTRVIRAEVQDSTIKVDRQALIGERIGSGTLQTDHEDLLETDRRFEVFGVHSVDDSQVPRMMGSTGCFT